MKLINQIIQKILHYSYPVIICVFLLALLFTNIILSPLGLRLDLSKNQAYSLSRATKNIIQRLKKPVTITFYVSSELPSRLLPLRNDVVDFIKEYQKNTKKITLKIIDPKTNTKAQEEINSLGIPELQFSQLEQNKYQISSAYFAVVITYEGKQEVIPQATDITNLEYNITSYIYRLTNTNIARIATIGMGTPYPTQGDPLGPIKGALQQQYQLDTLDLDSEQEKTIDPGYQLLIVVDDNKKEFTENDVDKIKGYLDTKGTAIILADGVWVNANLTTQKASHNLFNLFKSYNLNLENNLVLSESAEYVNFGNSLFQFLTPYPFWIKTNNFDMASGYSSNVPSVTFPWVSSVTRLNKTKKNVKVLASSPNNSWIQNEPFELNPQKIPQPNKLINNLPLVIEATSLDGKGKLILIPSSRFITSQYIGQESGNLDFFFNLVNNTTSKGALTGIRSRTISFSPLPPLPGEVKNVIKYGAILILPLLLTIYGAIRLFKRR